MSRSRGQEAQTSASSRQAAGQEQREVKTSFLLLRAALPGRTREYVAAAFEEGANERLWVPRISRASDSLQVMGTLA